MSLSRRASMDISIHAPREGGDHVAEAADHGPLISIHAPREGGDGSGPCTILGITNFNPRPPRGGATVC